MGQVDEANRCARRICVFFLGWSVFVSSMNATACYFVTGMEHENAEIARGLRRRDADLLDRLIEQYQSIACSGIWFILREIVNWPRTSSRKPGFACWNAAISTTANTNSARGFTRWREI